MADGIEPFPGLIEAEADLPLVRHRTLEVVDEQLWSEGSQARLHRVTAQCLGEMEASIDSAHADG
jgi:hypothetical protein